MKKKIKIIISGLVFVAIICLAIVIKVATAFKFNDDYATGNTNGNLYNEGLFCESNGYIYFANPYDDYTLYRMRSSGGKATKLIDDKVSCINVCGKYVYYKRFNDNISVDNVLKGNPYGIYRITVKGEAATELHRGIVDNVTLVGNYLYYRGIGDDNLYHLSKIRIDGRNDGKIIDKSYVPGCVYDKSIYFAEVDGNHNLYVMNTSNENISHSMEGNIYLPDIYDGWIYYIDCDNSRALTRKRLSGGNAEVLGEDHVINYNLSGEYGVIYYQAENGDTHKLMKMNPDGSMKQEVMSGDCSNISITSKYTYFYRILGDEKTLYRTPTVGTPEPEIYVIN